MRSQSARPVEREFLGYVRKSFIEECVFERRRAIHVKVPRRVDQMLEFVRQRGEGHRPHEIDRAHVLVDDSIPIGGQHIEHLGEVARRTARDATARRRRKEVAAEKESADVKAGIRRSQLVHCPCEEQYHALIVVDVGRCAEVG